MPLHTFTGVERIKVVEESHPLVGKCGKVVRRLQSFTGAMVNMDDELPDVLRRSRGDRNTVLFPDECEAVQG